MKHILITSALVTITAISSTAVAQQKQHPPQVQQIAKEIQTLLASQKDSFLTLTEKKTDRNIQVAVFTANGKRGLKLNIAYYPTNEKPDKALSSAGITLGKAWKLSNFEAGTFAEYEVPLEDSKYLAYAIHNVFRKFYKSTENYVLETAIEAVEPASEAKFDPGQVKVTVTAGNLPKAGTADVDGKKISFPGLLSTTSLNGKISDARIGNTDAHMEQYAVVLDTKGKQLAEHKSGFFQITGTLKIEKGSRKFVVTEFAKR